MSDVFIHEFLFRGGPTSSPDDDTWHVVLAREVTTIDGRDALETTTALTPERAAAMGFPLSRILSELNQSAVEQAMRYKAEADELRDRLDVRGHVEPTEEPEEKQSLLSTLTFGLLK